VEPPRDLDKENAHSKRSMANQQLGVQILKKIVNGELLARLCGTRRPSA
jgi:hypothetical protein